MNAYQWRVPSDVPGWGNMGMAKRAGWRSAFALRNGIRRVRRTWKWLVTARPDAKPLKPWPWLGWLPGAMGVLYAVSSLRHGEYWYAFFFGLAAAMMLGGKYLLRDAEGPWD